MTRSIVSVSKCLVSPSAITSIPVLSFLYQTPTILGQWRRNASGTADGQARHLRPSMGSAKQQRVAALKARNQSATDNASNKPIREPTEEITPALKGRLLDEGQENIDANANIFSKILQELPTSTRKYETAPKRRVVTMTQAEHEIFERLQALSLKNKLRNVGKEESMDEFDNPMTGYENLAELFHKIATSLEQAKSPEVQDPKSRIKTYESIQRDKQAKWETARRAQLKSVDWPQITTIEPFQYQLSLPGVQNKAVNVSLVDKAQSIRIIQNDLLEADTDRDLWQRVERKVFEMMRNLNTILERQEADRKKASKQDPRGKRQGAGITAVTSMSGIPNAGSIRDKAHIQKVMSAYGPAVLYFTRLFRIGFPNSPYMALILPTIKKLGPISQVLAASTPLYNELMYIRWEHHRDLNGCAELIEEMISQNILADRYTALVYQAVKDTRDYELGVTEQKPSSLVMTSRPETELSTISTTPASLAPLLDRSQQGTKYIPFGTRINSFKEGYWRLQGTEAAWLRLTKSYNRLVAITRREIQRRKDEEESSRNQLNAAEHQAGPDENARIARPIDEDVDLEPEIELLGDEDLNRSMMIDESQQGQNNVSVT